MPPSKKGKITHKMNTKSLVKSQIKKKKRKLKADLSALEGHVDNLLQRAQNPNLAASQDPVVYDKAKKMKAPKPAKPIRPLKKPGSNKILRSKK